MKENTKKYITVANVIACIAVVFLHFNVTYWSFGYDRGWISAAAIEAVCYFAVPMFFMISGANLINYPERYSTKEYLRRRVWKTVVPFLIWSLIGYSYQMHYGRITWEEISFKNVIDQVLNARVISIYWFFLPLFAVYLGIPVLAAIPKENRKRVFEYLIGICLIFNIAGPFLLRLAGVSYNAELMVPVAGGYLFYAVTGYYIDHYPIRKGIRYGIYLAGAAGLVLHFVGTWKYSFRDGMLNDTFKGYISLPCVVYAAAIFLLLKYLDASKGMERAYALCRYAGAQTFGVYLMHWYVLDYLITQKGCEPRSISFRVAGGIGTFLGCCVLTAVIRRIPVLKKIVP